MLIVDQKDIQTNDSAEGIRKSWVGFGEEKEEWKSLATSGASALAALAAHLSLASTALLALLSSTSTLTAATGSRHDHARSRSQHEANDEENCSNLDTAVQHDGESECEEVFQE